MPVPSPRQFTYDHAGRVTTQTDYYGQTTHYTNDPAGQLNNDLARFKQRVRTCIKVSISQNQYDALVMLAFNIGEDGLSKSSIVKLINDPAVITPYNSQESAWKAWNKSDKKFSQGVLNRRIAEWNIFTKNVYQRW